MADTRANRGILRGTLVLFIVCVLASAGMLSGSYFFRQKMEREYAINHANFRTSSQQYLAVDEEERIIEEFYPVFARMVRDGLLGEERRLSWLETLREAGSAIDIPELSYKLDAQREAEPLPGLTLGEFSVYVSPMSLNLGLLHEGDLVRLLDALEREAHGLYSVRRCDMRLREGALTADPDTPNVRADCVLEWLTLDLAGDRELAL